MRSGDEKIFKIFTGNIFKDSAEEFDDNGNEFIIPSFQRYYTWKESKVIDLLRDIDESISAGDVSFFLGSILLLKTKNPNIHHVIDGQQRLVTLSIIMRQIIDYINKDPETNNLDDVKLANRCLIKSKEEDKIDLNKILPANLNPRINFSLKSNDGDFREIVANRNIKNIANPPILAAFNKIHDHFNNKTQEYLKNYLHYLLHNVRIAFIRVEEKGRYANKIFETLNDRGETLTQLDLFKNFVLGYLPDDDKYNDYIMQCHVKLDYDIDKLARYFFIYSQMTNGYDKKNNGTNSWYRHWKIKILEKCGKEISDIQTHLQELLYSINNDIQFYNTSISKEDKLWVGSKQKGEYKDIDNMIDYLRRYSITHSLMFVLVKNYNQHKNNDKDFITLYRCIKILYLFIFRVWLIYGLSRTEKVEEIIANVAYTVNKTKDLVSPSCLMEILKEKGEGTPRIGLIDNDLFISKLTTIKYTNNQMPGEILKKIVHNEQKIDIGGKDNASEVSVEHILSHSEKHFQSNWANDFSFVEFLSYRDRLGNMTLLRQDENNNLSKDGNENFKSKKLVYSESGFNITKEIAKCKSWEASEIEKRQKKIAAKICQALNFPQWAFSKAK